MAQSRFRSGHANILGSDTERRRMIVTCTIMTIFREAQGYWSVCSKGYDGQISSMKPGPVFNHAALEGFDYLWSLDSGSLKSS